MKTLKFLLLFAFLVGIFSCEDFLEEDYLTGAATESHFTSSDGLETLVTACYGTNKIFWGKEEGFDFSVIGTDIYDFGQQHPQKYQFTYDAEFNPTNSRLVVLWIEFYKGVNACNDAIAVLSDPDVTPFDEEKTAKRLAEVRYLRAMYNWLIVELWGGAELRTEPIEGVVKTAQRHSVDEFYVLIFEDLDYAVANLSDDDNTAGDEYGRVTKLAATAFRARMKLTRASYLNDNTLYQEAANDAIAVITSGQFTLNDNYADIWDLENNDNNPENIWAINYSYNQYAAIGVPEDDYQAYQRPGDKPWDGRDGGHHGHLMFGMQYDIMPGMTRDLDNGRPFRRYSPTKYLIDVFDETVDQRFQGSFKTVWFANFDPNPPRFPLLEEDYDENDNDVDSIVFKAKYTALDGTVYYLDSMIVIDNDDFDGTENDTIKTADGQYIELYKEEGDDEYEILGVPMLAYGDTAILYTKEESFPDNKLLTDVQANYLWHIDRGFWCLDYDRMFNSDGTTNDLFQFDRNLFFELNKFYDNTRAAANGEGSERGKRDSYVMRIPEMYLIAAEALWKSGNAADAYTNYLIPLANKRAIGGNGAAMLAAYGINSGADLTMDFFMDERAREFAGEQMRWFDLKRLGTAEHVARIQQYAGNAEARANFSEKHTLRPIPQVQIDAVTNKDEFGQNPGY